MPFQSRPCARALLTAALVTGAATSGLKVGTFTTQTDVKNTWPDGSIKFAIVTARIPASGSYAITPAARSVGTFTPTLGSAAVKLTIAGTTWTAISDADGARVGRLPGASVRRRAADERRSAAVLTPGAAPPATSAMAAS